MLNLLLVVGSALLLVSCGRSPGFLVRTISFSEPTNFAVLQEKFTGTDQLAVNSDALADGIQASIKSGKLFVGDRVFSEGSFVSDRYAWNVTTPCSSLPQGDAIGLRYELCDSSGIVLQTNKSNLLVKISLC
jgi:hypothetical protein